MSIINKVSSKVLPVLIKSVKKVILPALKIAWPILAALSLVFPPLVIAAMIVNVLKSGCETVLSRIDKDKVNEEKKETLKIQEHSFYKYDDTLDDSFSSSAIVKRVNAREHYKYILYANKLANMPKHMHKKEKPIPIRSHKSRR